MAGINKAIILGNIGKIDSFTSSLGNLIVNCSIATSTKSKDGKEETSWHSVVAFGKVAEIMEKYVKKGSKVYIEGPIKYETYEKDGVTKYSTKIIANQIQLLSGKDEAQQEAPRQKSLPADQYNDLNDDIPF